MSVVACVKVYDGIVLGSESMTQLWGPTSPGATGFVKAFSNARKLFKLGGSKFAVLAYGIGNLGHRSVESYMEEFSERKNNDQLTGEQIANALLSFIRTPYNAAFDALPADKKPVMGFYIAGYAPNQHVGTEWEFVLPQDANARQSRPDNQFGASWRGVAVPFSRLHFGVDPRLISTLQTGGMPQDMINRVQDAAKQLESPIVFDGMPLQDAIGFCRFILETTINVCTYEVGVPVCGGPLHIAIVTRAAGFSWISQPGYSLN
jgi:hypothetical protein